jgi:hypothetical protein
VTAVCLDDQLTRDANGKHYNHTQRWAAELGRIVDLERRLAA